MAGAVASVMAKTCAALLAFLCGTACIADDELSEDVRTPSDDAQEIEVSAIALPPDDLCALLPDCGACSFACDPEQLQTFVPPGTCAAFVCELIDGRTVSVHACHP